jgi:hypothetical protein
MFLLVPDGKRVIDFRTSWENACIVAGLPIFTCTI